MASLFKSHDRNRSGPPARILVLEDEAPPAKIMNFVLTLAGYEVTTIADGNEGLAAALAGNFDLCLLNVMLPGRDGVSIAREIERAGIRLPLIFVTGYGRESFESRAGDLVTRVGYFEKPFAPEKLLAAVKEALGPKQ